MACSEFAVPERQKSDDILIGLYVDEQQSRLDSYMTVETRWKLSSFGAAGTCSETLSDLFKNHNNHCFNFI